MYATRADIDNLYGEDTLYSVAGDGNGGVDTARVDHALADATDEVEMSLRGRYALPLSPIPPIVRRWVIDIALALVPSSGAAGSDLIAERAKAARQSLKDVRSGGLVLDLPTADPAAPGGAGLIAFDGPGIVFDSANLRGM